MRILEQPTVAHKHILVSRNKNNEQTIDQIWRMETEINERDVTSGEVLHGKQYGTNRGT